MEKDFSATTDEDEHLNIISCLLRLQAELMQLPNIEEQSFGDGRASQCRGWSFMLYDDYFTDE
jgi:hypothetical protein